MNDIPPEVKPDVGSKDFLDLFPTESRSRIMNAFLFPIRAGLLDPREIISRVWASAHDKAVRESSDRERSKYLGLCLAVEGHPHKALDLALYCLWRESWPADEQTRLKTESATRHREAWMRKQPATQRQVMFLHQLGFRGPVGDRGSASVEISRRIGGRS